jgi:hypothetical protein
MARVHILDAIVKMASLVIDVKHVNFDLPFIAFISAFQVFKFQQT